MMRQITFYKFEVGIKELVEQGDDMFKLVKKPVTVVEATAMSKGDARKAIIDAGAECPRGTEVYWSKLGRVLYKFETEALLAAATSREELSL